MIDIFYTSFREPLPKEIYSELLSLLPKDLQERNERFLRWQDKHANLFGKLLLIEALKYHNINNNLNKLILYGEHKRPFLTLPSYDFNISHSGEYAMCAIGQNVRVGVDIEKKQQRNFENFDNTMNSKQWDHITTSEDPVKTFYKYWTIKESVSKADGRGFYIPYAELEVKDATVQYEGKLWFLNEINLAEDYSVTMATNKLSSFKLHKLNFKNN